MLLAKVSASDTGIRVGPDIKRGYKSTSVIFGRSSIDRFLVDSFVSPNLFLVRTFFQSSSLRVPSALEKVLSTSS